jgi:molybdopterin synthase catalytic subunit
MSFSLTDRSIDPVSLLAELNDTRAGACVTFEGRVRAQNGGRAVKALDYEAYGPLAEKEGVKIVAEAMGKFQIMAVICVHRTGALVLGDLAVWVAVTALHRGAAFEACRYVIDQVKDRVPIWKKEHYLDGISEWINCASKSVDGGKPGAG